MKLIIMPTIFLVITSFLNKDEVTNSLPDKKPISSHSCHLQTNDGKIFQIFEVPVQQFYSGKVVDENNLPMPGVVVEVIGDWPVSGVITDAAGKWAIGVRYEEGPIEIRFRYIGYKTLLEPTYYGKVHSTKMVPDDEE